MSVRLVRQLASRLTTRLNKPISQAKLSSLHSLLPMPALVVPTASPAASLEGRVTRLENILDNQRSSDLLLQIQRLQQEIQDLRGLLERQDFEIARLKRLQKDQYLDLDTRLRAQGGEATTGAQPTTDDLTAAPDGTERPADVMLTPKDTAGTATSSGPTASNTPATGARSPGEREAYRKGFDLLKQRRYDEAAAAFNDLLARYPSGEFSDNARYWLGETYYVKRDYSSAIAEFQRVLDNYPLSPKVPGAMLKIGYIQDERKDWKRARMTLEELVRKFPGSTEARLAQGRLERMARDGH